jgi:multiple sugar transport system permease protein
MATLTQEQRQRAEQEASAARLRKFGLYLVNYGLLIFLAFIFLFPIIFMIVAGFKEDQSVIADLDSVEAFLPNPDKLTTDNISNVFDRVPFPTLFFNSMFITVVTVSAGLFVNSMAAYVLARIRFFGRNTALIIIVSLIIIPLEAIAVPLMMQVNTISGLTNFFLLAILLLLTVLFWAALWNAFAGLPIPVRIPLIAVVAAPFEVLLYYLLRQTLDGGTWLNTYHVQILPFLAEPFAIFLFYQFFIGLPKDFDEAAYVDGAGAFRIYWQIIVPLSRPVFATVAILQFLRFWGFYMWPLMVTRGEDYQPLMVGMDYFRTQAPIQWGSIMAYAAMVTIPMLIVFLLFQKWFIQSVSSSGVKG